MVDISLNDTLAILEGKNCEHIVVK